MGVVKLIQFTGEDAVQEHSRSTEIESEAVPPADAKLVVCAETVASQRVEAGAVTLVEVVAELPHATVARPATNSRAVRNRTGPASAQRSPGVLVLVLSLSSPAEHTLSNSLRFPFGLRLRELSLLVVALIASGCGGAYTLGPARNLALAHPGVAWLSPLAPRDAGAIAEWRAAVGSPIIVRSPSTPAAVPSDQLTIISWNIALDGGDVVQLVRDAQQRAPGRPIVLLIQEAFRSGDDVPAAVEGEYAGHLGMCRREREIDDVARALGFSLYYVPSMRNGAPSRHREDRGNAVLSSLPLTELSAIELPFERQRRVAAAARIAGRTSTGEPWSLRLVSVHLDNLAGLRSGWIASEYGRARQARGLRDALDGEDPMVLAGDFNTWFGFSDQVYRETEEAFPQTRVTDDRRTFRGLLRLDHVFYRTPPRWKTEVRRAESNYGSDHYPLITTITF